MHNPLNILMKHTIFLSYIIILYFTFHPKHLLANNNNEISKNSIIKVFNLINNNQWDKAEKILQNKKEINLTNWLKISSKSNIKKDELLILYNNYKTWPNITNLLKKIENQLTWENFDQNIFNIFDKNEAISPLGQIKLSNYKIKNKADGHEKYNKIIINNWINGNFIKSDEKYIIKNYSHLFNENAQITRLNNLIWKKKWSSANRQVKRVNKKIKLLTSAKIKLARRQYGVDNAIQNVPKELLNDEGLIYERVKWRRKSGLDEESYALLKAYLMNNNIQVTKPDIWWKEIYWHTRNLFNKKKI